MKIVFYGSSLLSAYWNGAATYYRGILRALAARGCEITFCEPDAHDRQRHRDIEIPDWTRVVVYEATPGGVRAALAEARAADVIVKASGVGYADDTLLQGVLDAGPRGAVRAFWDVDAPATLAEVAAAPDHPLRRALGRLDLVLTYGGGPPVVEAYRRHGAAECVPIYNGLDPDTHHPAPEDPRFAADLGLLANRLPDREARIAEFFLDAARRLPDRRFLLGGSGWDGAALPPNVRALDHVGTADHNAFNCTPRAVLNVSRESMAANGYSPATRVFEAAGAGACLITDAWEGIEMFLAPGSEILVARDGQEVAELLAGLTPERAQEIGSAAHARALAEHTYEKRADLAFRALSTAFARRRVAVP
jgi:spore maturation protein CgeB